LRAKTTQTREALDVLLGFLEGHLTFCQSILENYHLASFSAARIKLADYFNRHRQIFDQYFGCATPPTLPFKVPHLLNSSEVIVEVKTQSEYHRLKTEYEKVVPMIEKMKASVPQKWPQILPNLSTHDGKPPLKIGNDFDFGLVLGQYYEFITGMEKLKDSWTFALRIFYQFLHATTSFEKPGAMSLIKDQEQ